jgi:DNA primase
MLAIGNIKNTERYFKAITPEILAQIAQAPKEPDPATLLAQAEMEKTRAKMAESIAKSDFNDRKLRADDDFRRDQLNVTSVLSAAEIQGKFAIDLNEQELEALNVANEFNEPAEAAE